MRIKAGRAAVSRTPGRTFPTFKVGSEMGFDFSHRHKQFGQQVKSRTDRLAIAAALSN